MRVLINTLPLYNKGEGGLRTYTLGLLQALHQSNADMEWHVLLRQSDLERLGLAADARFRQAPTTALTRFFNIPGGRFGWRHIVEHLLLPVIGRRFDVVHYLDSYGPMGGIKNTPLLLTVHDIIPLMDKPYFSGWVKSYLSMLMRRSIPCADYLMADSQVTADDLRQTLDIPAQRIGVVPIGIADRFHPATAAEHRRIVAHYQLTAPTFIFVGGINPRKNVARLIHAFARAKHEHQLPHHLLLVGKLAWEYEDVLAAIQQVQLGDALRHLGHVPDGDIAPLIAAADAMTFVSLDEGFGLPVVEAMACGTPVLTSNVSSLREVAGNAGLLVDPQDEVAIAAALVRLGTEPDLRAHMREAGLKHARRYRWSTVAETALDVYRHLAARQPPLLEHIGEEDLSQTLKRPVVPPKI